MAFKNHPHYDTFHQSDFGLSYHSSELQSSEAWFQASGMWLCITSCGTQRQKRFKSHRRLELSQVHAKSN
eukprot:770379-Amphidinium_carterae.1